MAITTTPRVDPAHGGPIEDATLPELVGRVINDVSDLADKQIELAKQEVGELKDRIIRAVIALAIGAAIALAAALLLVIWLWTGFIWFFNWIGAFFGAGWLGWPLGLLVPALAAFVAYKRFIQRGINQVTHLEPLSRTRASLKEDLEWVRQLTTRNAR